MITVTLHAIGLCVIAVAFGGAVAAMVATWQRHGDQAIDALFYAAPDEPQAEPHSPSPLLPMAENPNPVLRILVPATLVVLGAVMVSLIVLVQP